MPKTSTPTVTAYDILGIPTHAEQKEIHAALRKLALEWHPDRVPPYRRGEATLRFQSIMDAYNNLRTPEARTQYDKILKNAQTQQKRAPISNDNRAQPAAKPAQSKARAWFKAIETILWPIRSEKDQ